MRISTSPQTIAAVEAASGATPPPEEPRNLRPSRQDPVRRLGQRQHVPCQRPMVLSLLFALHDFLMSAADGGLDTKESWYLCPDAAARPTVAGWVDCA